MLKIAKALAAAALVAIPSIASAAPINVGQLYGMTFSGVGTQLDALGAGTAPTNPNGFEPGNSPWTFTLNNPGTLLVIDLFISVDEFEIFNFGSSLGTTSAATDGGSCGSDFTCALADSRYSRGIFNLAAGSYSITGTQIAGIAGAGAFIVEETAVPVPAGAALLATGIAAFAGMRRLRKDQKA